MTLDRPAGAAATPLANLLRHRWLLYELVARDIKLRYRGSVLGYAWTLLNPLLFMGVYTLVFGVYLKIGIPEYPVFLLSGLLPWNWFASALQQGTSSILDGRMYVGKTVFPIEVLVIVPMLSNFINFSLSLPLFFLVVAAYHGHLGLPLVALPLLVAFEMVITVATLFIFATLNVFYRDFSQLVVYVVMLMFYVTPIFYSVDAIPEAWRSAVLLNPMATLMLGYQSVLYANRFPDADSLLYLFVSSVLLFAFARRVFRRYKDLLGEYL